MIGTLNSRVIASLIFAVVVVFVFSLAVSPYYLGGDQVHYRLFYDLARNGDGGFFTQLDNYRSVIGSGEYGYFLLVWVFSTLVEKDLFIALSNSALAGCLFYILLRLGVRRVVAAFFLFDYYIVVSYFSAERLKYGLLMLFLSVIFSGKLRYFFWLLSGFFHVQSIIPLVAKWASEAAQGLREVISKGRFYFTGSLGVYFLILLSLIFLVGDHAMGKFDFYYGLSSGFGEIGKALIFLVASLVYAKNDKLNAFFMQSVVLGGVFLMGSDRLTIFSCAIFLYFALKVRGGLNFGVVIYLFYSMYKSFVFLGNVFDYGNGYYGA